VIVAMDFFTVPTFRVLYVWFAIRHSRREIVHCSVTESPTSPWVVQQLREVFPFDDAGGRSRYLVLDRDTIFSAAVVTAIASMGLEPTRTSYQSPWQNGVAERFVGTVRRDLLDHVIVLDGGHLRRLLSEYLAYYHGDRTHLGVEKDAPVARPVELRPSGIASVYAWRGDRDQAFEWLERSYTERNARLRFIKYDPLLRRLRDDPRYTSLLRKMNLPVEQVGWPPSSR